MVRRRTKPQSFFMGEKEEKVISVYKLFEWLYRAVVIYLLYNCWVILEGFLSLVLSYYGK